MRLSLLTAALLGVAGSAHAQQSVPSAGSLLQQIPPVVRPEPRSGIDLVTPDQIREPVVEGARVHVSAVRVTGVTLFAEQDLAALTGISPGSDLTLAELRNGAAEITDFYNDKGYFLARAYLPAQEISGGLVTIAVTEGRYGTIAVRNGSRLDDGVAAAILDRPALQTGEVVTIRPLERALLLLSDTPGVVANSTLSPAARPGASDLTIELANAPLISGSLEADNVGDRYSGRYRFGGSLNLNNPTGAGDLASLRVLTSGEGLGYGRASYQRPLGEATIGTAYTHVDYTLGEEFTALDAGGSADIFGVFASYPILRSRRANVSVFGSVDHKRLKDDIGLVSQSSRKTIDAVGLGLRGDALDAFGGGGATSWSLIGTAGSLDIRSPLERAADAATAGSQGGFGKLQYSLARSQTLVGPLSLYGALRGQVASGNLDTTEKMQLGGAYAVRAYPEGEAYGDEGYVATVETRLELDRWTPALPGRLQVFSFVDWGEVDVAQSPWFAGSNHERRSGAGVGLVWQSPSDLIVRTTWARRNNDQRVTSGPDRRDRFSFQIVQLF
ncbi:Polypeptide-transport-associated domain protein ShlB-type [Brevundimonas subvibrioides ATCC 15264]|uniref:Polypeptide-transport-associated domain protein ShlB-type n=1 Tax=Brevundimonas subvibrioides (strain ATCC 15264 / DSM 4735 / LMG 14903 / NBRC 16000 / CB 81) TaxID=633149 RepID=D9QH21_BRESC|nr:Polypeptide-transport-associated domain protein ShlB-type [Brevundimonas subvibrioides ATCC 15264]